MRAGVYIGFRICKANLEQYLANQNLKYICGVYKYLKIACIILGNENSRNICGAYKYV